MTEGITWDDVEAQRTPVTTSVPVCLRNDLVADIERLEAELVAARIDDDRLNRAPVAPQIAARIVELQDEARAHQVNVVFRELPRRQWTDLLAAHPPTQEDREAGNDFNADTFPPAAMAASCVSPTGMTAERMRRIYDEWSLGQIRPMWRACLKVNTGASAVPKSAAASAILRAFERSSTTADPAASPEASSSGA